MTVLSAASPVLQMSAITRAENLRRLGIPEIDKVLDEYADTHYMKNAGLTDRERICRLANKLASITDPAEARPEIYDVVQKLRRAFGLLDATQQHGLITGLIEKLNRQYPVYGIGNKLHVNSRFAGARDVVAMKAEAARMVSELLVIGMNADGEGFRSDLERTIQEVMKVMLTWM